MSGHASYSDSESDSAASGDETRDAMSPRSVEAAAGGSGSGTEHSGGPMPALPAADQPEDMLLSASRAYQLEMFEESLKRNIIVAMDTGTGKTRVAILRIRAELERSPPPKIVWFLAPTVFLCFQQFDAISSQIPGVQGKIVTGESGVDAWKTQEIWDAVLLNVRVVVATPQVLLDALMHGFVNMDSISLLVFDEAHGCVKDNPGRRIMTEFYHSSKVMGQSHPAILGLTASPVQGKKLDSFEQLESTLDATCVTPTRHRDVLIAHTKRPSTLQHLCIEQQYSTAYDSNLARLRRIESSGNAQPLHFSQAAQYYGGSLSEKDVKWTWKFLKTFRGRADRMCEQLGPWAAEYYIHKVIRRCVRAARKKSLEDKKPYLLSLLQQVDAARPGWPDSEGNYATFLAGLSSRVQKLVTILLAHKGDRPTGIVFVEERPMAAVLARLISLHPLTRPRFQAGHVVGMSQLYTGGFDEVIFLSPKDGRKPLQRFRTRKLNLLVATSVIEEGIDIPACNFVVCINELTNLKAFIQRRGRARETNSEFHLLTDVVAQKRLSREWESLEMQMKRRYEDDMREAERLRDIEAISDMDDRLPPLYVPATKAQLRAKDAKAHLQHFCATMSSAAFVDWRPIYILHEKKNTGLLRASVQLPITLPPHLRRVDSAYSWRAESSACADAAFQAYGSLYRDGLLSDNLLPPRPSDDMLKRYIEGRPGVVAVHKQYRPWPGVYQNWKAALSSPPGNEICVFRHAIRVTNPRGYELYAADLVLPCTLPDIRPFQMFWTAHSKRPWTVHISQARRQTYGPGHDQYYDDGDHAGVLLSAAYGHRWPIGDQHRLVRVVCADEHIRKEQLSPRVFERQIFANTQSFFSPHMACLVRDPGGMPYIYQEVLESKPPLSLVRKVYKGFEEAPESAAYVVVRPWPKLVGFLHETANVDVVKDTVDPASTATASARPYPRILPATDCRVDNLPMAYVQFGALLPPLIPVLEVYLVAAELLSSTRLSQLPVRDMRRIAEAISAPAARLPTNYEYLEFIGDSILKVCATVNCAAQNLHAPEGHLSLCKDRLVANSRLSRAALELGLDRFIVSTQWSLKKWMKYCDGLEGSLANDVGNDGGAAGDTADTGSPGKQDRQLEMSTKMLADVVEALIGACHEDSGMPSALQCINLFIHDFQWLSLEASRDILYDAASAKPPWPPPPALEELIGYTFTKKSLLVEAMTHASVPSEDEGGCMERLEFIGDAILDHVLVQKLASMRPSLSYYKMHLLRTTLANAGFLGFATMAFDIVEPATVVSPDKPIRITEFKQPLWAFMKHGASREMDFARKAAGQRFDALKDGILKALWAGHEYPWTLFAQLRAEKFYSDVLEAVIGAIWVDSGSIEAVEALLEATGVLPYLRRAVDEDIHLLHPKEELGNITGSGKIRYDVTSSAEGKAGSKNGNGKGPHKENPIHEDEDEDEDSDDSNEDSDDEDEAMEDESDTGGAIHHGDAVVYSCRLFINDECVAEVSDGVSREEAETRAAEVAVKAWKKKGGAESSQEFAA